MTDFKDWIGRQECTTDTIDLELVRRMSATMDRTDSWKIGDVLPACWHWMFFNEIARQSRIGADGHPRRGTFLPPLQQPRRMWAGCRLAWKDGFRLGSSVEKESTILRVESKTGKTGEMVFVTVRYIYRECDRVLLEEEQDIVYRADATDAERHALMQLAARATAAGYAPEFSSPRDHTRSIRPDPVQLFRYSALTFNGHRIHYDNPYALHVERYPGLLVHGTLLATMLLDFLQASACLGQDVNRFEFSLRRPTFAIADFHLHAMNPDADGKIKLWTSDNVGEVALDGWASCPPATQAHES